MVSIPASSRRLVIQRADNPGSICCGLKLPVALAQTCWVRTTAQCHTQDVSLSRRHHDGDLRRPPPSDFLVTGKQFGMLGDLLLQVRKIRSQIFQ
jgi:hypothetical protein